MKEETDTTIPFSFFVSLLEEIAAISPRKANQTARSKYKDLALRTLNNWIAELHRRYSPLPPGTTAVFFRFFFPEEDVQRKYGIQEKKLCDYLRDVFSPGAKGTAMCEWDRVLQAQDAQDATCLGEKVARAFKQISMIIEDSLSMHEVDALLTELASTCAFSSSSIRHSIIETSTKRTPRTILTLLYPSMSPSSAGFLTQIILKDLRPILYPLSETHYTASLLQYNSRSVSMLSKEDAMNAWDSSGRMLKMYRVRASLEDAANVFENDDSESASAFVPQVGVPVQIPKCLKARSCADAVRLLQKSEKVWVETKYDGERAQIHVEVDQHGKSRITIFSKSKRDSTMDRFGVHQIIRQVLGLPEPGDDGTAGRVPRIRKNVILEAEMVAFSDTLNKVDEFWRIRSLVASTAKGVRHRPLKPRSKQHNDEEEDDLDVASQLSLLSSTSSTSSTRHLALVFFDVLLLDSTSLLYDTYARRRAVLEDLLKPGLVWGRAMVAERVCVDMRLGGGGEGGEGAVERLEKVFARLLSRHEEGAVLKAEEGVYASRGWSGLRWIKLKADYIPGYGDTVDLALIGAGWDKDRAAELRVSSSVYTTFYFGALANPEELLADAKAIPHFKGIFTSSYGLDREKLEELNFLIKSSDPIVCERSKKHPLPAMSYTFEMPPNLTRPLVLLQRPLLAELFGAGFTKAPGCTFYELRFPRITKVYSPSCRPCLPSSTSITTSSWATAETNCLSYASLQLIARESVGKDRPGKDVDDWCKRVWGKPVSPGVDASPRRRRREEEWVERLRAVDGVDGGGVSSLEAKGEVHGERARKRAKRDAGHGGEGENVKALGKVGEGGTAAGRGLRALGSMTNVFAGSRTDAIRLNGDALTAVESTTPARSIAAVEDTAIARSAEHNTPKETQSKTTSNPRAQNASPPQAESTKASDKLTLPTPPSSSPIPPLTPSPPPNPPTPKYSHTPLAEFLSPAVVYLFRSTSAPRPAWRVPTTDVIPRGNMVNSFDAFMLACGFSESENAGGVCEWAERGVLFVDEREKMWVDVTLKRLVERRVELLQYSGEAVGKRGMKPVFVFSLKMLGRDVVESVGDVEARSLCRVG